MKKIMKIKRNNKRYLGKRTKANEEVLSLIHNFVIEKITIL